MRISDADRSRAVDELRRHCAAGRIDIDAYADRIAEAMAAETLADLDHALRDLPTVRIAEPAADPPLFAPGRPRSSRAGRDTFAASPRAGVGSTGPGRPGDRLRARLVVILSVLIVIVAAGLVILAHWFLAVVLVVGWIAGVLQGRIRIGRR